MLQNYPFYHIHTYICISLSKSYCHLCYYLSQSNLNYHCNEYAKFPNVRMYHDRISVWIFFCCVTNDLFVYMYIEADRFVYLPIYLIYISIYPSIYLSIYLYIYPSINQSIYLSMRHSTLDCWYFCQFINLRQWYGWHLL